MTRGEYLALIGEQIHCKKAIPLIQSELENHIEDQKEAYVGEGIPEKEAEILAVKQMGDPVETGIQLDRIHREKTDWVLPIIAIGIAIFGIIMQCLMFHYEGGMAELGFYLKRTIFYNSLGIGMMMVIRKFDYRLLDKYIWKIYLGYLLLCASCLLFAPIYNGTKYGGNFVTMCFVPIFAVMVYHFREEGQKGVIKSFLFLGGQVVVSFICSKSTFTILGAMMLTCCFTILVAIIKNMYQGSQRKQISIWGGLFSGTFCLIFAMSRWYLLDRIRAFFYPERYKNTYAYCLNIAREQLRHARIFGGGNLEIADQISGAHSDYLLAGTAAYFGLVATALLLTIVVFFLWRAFSISYAQRNRLGSLLGSSLSILLILKNLIYIGSNLGIFPGTAVSMPFFCYGLQDAIINFSYLGIILSVCRYTNIFGEKRKKKYKLVIEEVI